MRGPTVVNSATTNNGLAASVSLTMPSGLVVGNTLLLLLYGGRSTTQAFSVSGWTLIGSLANSSNTNEAAAAYAHAITTGSETATWTTDDSAVRGVGAICHQLQDCGAIADFKSAGTNNGAGPAVPDSPSLTAAANTDNLWFTLGAGSGTPTMTAPTNYTNLSTATLGLSSYTVAQARRALLAGTENPGAWTGSLTRPVGLTVSVPPRVSSGDFMSFL